MEFQLEKFQPGDEEEILELLQLVFGGWPHFDLSCTPLEYWKWKHLDNPFSRRMILKAVNKGDKKIIGCYHGTDLMVKFGDDFYHVNNGVDLGVHPDHRRMGVYREMNEIRMKNRENVGAKMSFWSTSNPIVMNNIQNWASFEFPEVISHYVRIRDLDLHFKMVSTDKSWINKIGYRILDSMSKVSNTIKPQLPSDKKVKIERISEFDSKIDKFWEEISKDYSFIVERRQDYLNWRYCDPRGGNYHVYVAEEDDSIVGCARAGITKNIPGDTSLIF